MQTRSKKRKLQEIAGGPPVGRGPLTKRKGMPELQLQEFLEREIAHGHMHEKKRIRRPKDHERPFRKSKKPRYHGLMVRKELS